MANENITVNFEFPLQGKVALITGGGSGLGTAAAEAFAAKGATVAVVDVNEEAAQEVAEKIGGDARAFAADVTDPESVQQAVDAVVEAFGRIDILINSAGIARLAPAEELSFQDWKDTIDVNLTGSFLMAQAAGKVMLSNGYGRIVNLASQAGHVALDKHTAYMASKAGILGLTKSLAAEWGQHGVTCNSLSPTVVLTPLGAKAWEGPVGDAHKAEIPNRRFAMPDEIAAALVYLASTESAMVNGADLRIDGGFTIR